MSSRQARDDAVTSVIGTVLVLVVSVAGLGLTMLVGAPLMKRMDDQAAVEASLGRFDSLQDAVWRLAVAHEGLSVPMDPLGGTLEIQNGTRTVVAMGLTAGRLSGANTDPCQVKLKSWADGDNEVQFETSTCKAPQKRGAGQTEGRGNPHTGGDSCTTTTQGQSGNVKVKCTKSNGNKGGRSGNGDKCGQNANSACIQAYALPDFGVDHVTNVTTQAGKLIVELDMDLEGHEWLFHLTSQVGLYDEDGLPIEPTTYAEAWVLDQSRLRWNRPGPGGGVEVMMEGGSTFSNTGLGDAMETPLPVAENGPGDGTYFIRFISLDSQGFGPGTSATSAELRMTLSAGFIRSHFDNSEVDTLRYQFAGRLGDAWCAALLQRNGGFGMPTGFSYSADSPCITGDTTDNNVRSILYKPTSGNFSVIFSEVVLDVRLNP